MNTNLASTRYRLNLVRELREREKRREKRRQTMFLVGLGCFGLLITTFLLSGLAMWKMERVLASEQLDLTRLKLEYNKYKVTKLIVDKSDIELLNELKGRGIFWTHIIAALAKHLPDNYWITRFKFSNNELQVSGYGYVSPRQDQLLVLDAYLNYLRADTSFSDVFRTTRLIATRRTTDQSQTRISFDFSAYTSKWKAQ